LLTGRPVFKAATPLDTILQMLHDEPVPPARLQSRTPADLERVCLKCLDKDPGRRYGSATELAEELGRFQRGEPVQARPLGRTTRSWRWCRRNPAVAGLLAAVAAALMVGTAVALVFAAQVNERAVAARQAEALAQTKAIDEEAARKDADQMRRDAQQETARAEGQLQRAEGLAYLGLIARAHRAWEDNDVAQAWDLLDATRWDLRGWEYRYLYTLFRSNQVNFRHPDTSEVASICYSPDGKRLASVGGTVIVWDVQTGAKVLSIPARAHSICFSPDGKRLAGDGGDGGTVEMWDAQTGAKVLSIPAAAHSICFSPDGKRLAGAQGDTVKIWDACSGAELATVRGPSWAVTSVAYSPDGTRLAIAGLHVDEKWGVSEVKLWDARTGRELLTLSSTSALSQGFMPLVPRP
jgi:hypothetical protein